GPMHGWGVRQGGPGWYELRPATADTFPPRPTLWSHVARTGLRPKTFTRAATAYASSPHDARCASNGFPPSTEKSSGSPVLARSMCLSGTIALLIPPNLAPTN